MWLGMKAAVKKIAANSISPTVMCRMNAGGDQICGRIHARDTRHKPQTMTQVRRSRRGEQRRDSRSCPRLRDRLGAAPRNVTKTWVARKYHQPENEDRKPMYHPAAVATPYEAAVEDRGRQCKPVPAHRKAPMAASLCRSLLRRLMLALLLLTAGAAPGLAQAWPPKTVKIRRPVRRRLHPRHRRAADRRRPFGGNIRTAFSSSRTSRAPAAISAPTQWPKPRPTAPRSASASAARSPSTRCCFRRCPTIRARTSPQSPSS